MVGLSDGEVKHQDRCEPSQPSMFDTLPSLATAEGIEMLCLPL